jgi:UDP-glucuronate 4-epimerase
MQTADWLKWETLMNYLVTGAAGFVGAHVTAALIAQGHHVTGIDNLNAYYDPALKLARLEHVAAGERFTFSRLDLADRAAVESLFASHTFDRVIHLAAQAGVRYSIDHPHAYIEANVTGFLNILEACRHQKVPHLVYASSSSVYGLNTSVPFAETDRVDHPVSLYAATKKSNELMAHTYAHLFNLPVTGLRFFTVYGPWGRPDMAYFSFTKAILEGRPIDVFNSGNQSRDFTYIDDIVEGVVRVAEQIPDGVPPYRLYNIGNNNPVQLIDFIRTIERATGREAEVNMLPMQPGDVTATHANIDALSAATGFKPSTDLATGIGRFVDWYRGYYKI